MSLTIIANGRDVAAEVGDTILSALRRTALNVFHVCGGRGMCGTCRVAVADDWVDRLPPPAFSETRLLRVLKLALPNHRLACQTVLDEHHDGLQITLDPPPSRLLQKETT